MDLSEKEFLRLEALDRSVRVSLSAPGLKSINTDELIVARAKKFYKFLKGKKSNKGDV